MSAAQQLDTMIWNLGQGCPLPDRETLVRVLGEVKDALPTAPSAPGGEVVVWRVWSAEGEGGLFYHEDVARENAGETSRVQPLFAHPARMPTREQAIEIIDSHPGFIANVMDENRIWLAGLLYEALFRTGETKSDVPLADGGR